MKKNFILLYYLFIGIGAFAQTKVTDFKGQKTVAPLNVQKIGVLNDQLIFTATTSDKSGIWSTDGSAAGTKFLPGNQIPDFDFCTAYSLRLQQSDAIVVTACYGTKVARITNQSVNIFQLEVNTRINAIYDFKNEVYALAKDQDGNNGSILKLLSSGNVELVKSGIGPVQHTDAGFFYSVSDNDSKFHALYFFDGTTTSKIREYSDDVSYNTQLEVSLSGNQAIIVADKGKASAKELIFYDTSTKKVIKTQDWGGANPVRQRFISGENGKTYIAKSSTVDSRFSERNFFDLFLLLPNDSTKFVTTLSTSKLIPEGVGSSGNTFTMSYVTDNELIYSVTGINSYGLVEKFILFNYNFTTDKLTRSEDLKASFYILFDRIPAFTQISSAGVTFVDFKGRNLTYDFSKQAIVSFDESAVGADSVAIVNQRQLLISNNVYRLDGENSIPLIKPEEVFAANERRIFLRKEINNKLLLFRSGIKTSNAGIELAAVTAAGLSENLLTVPDEYFWGNSEKGLYNVADKVYFLTRTIVAGEATDIYSAYASGGTKATTSKIGSLTSSQFSLFRAYANDKQLIYLTESGRVSGILKIENDKLSKISVPDRFKNILQNSSETYFIAGREGFSELSDIYILRNDKFELIAENTTSQAVINNVLVYAKFAANLNNPLGFFSYLNRKETMVVPNAYSVVRTVGSNAVFSNIAGNKFLVYDVAGDKEVVRFEQPLAVRIDVQYINGAIVFLEPNKFTVAKGNSLKTVELDKTLQKSALFPVANGFLILSAQNYASSLNRSLSYYNLTSDELRKVETSVAIESAYVNNDAKFAILYVRIPVGSGTNRTFDFWFWDETMMEIRKINNDNYNSNFINSAGRIFIESNYNYMPFWQRVWYHSPGTYEAVATTADINSDGYIQLYKAEGEAAIAYSYRSDGRFTENPIRQYTKDKTIEFPVINAGSGGVNVQTVFPYEGQMYAYAFTYTDGWQVWNLGKLIEEELNYLGETALSTEEIVLKVNVFPNPTTDEITVTSEEPVSVEMLNVTGYSLMTADINRTHVLSTQNLPAGMYFLVIKNGEKRVVRKVVKE